MSKVKKAKLDYKSSVEPEYVNLLIELESGGSQKNEIRLQLLNILKVYFDDMRELDPLEPWFDIEPLIDAELNEKKYKTHKRNHLIGGFASALCRLGCSKNQAYLAMSEWLSLKGLDTPKKAHVSFEKKGIYAQEMDADDFVHLTAYGLKSLIDTAEAEFPTKYIKARKAYERLEAIVDECLGMEN